MKAVLTPIITLYDLDEQKIIFALVKHEILRWIRYNSRPPHQASLLPTKNKDLVQTEQLMVKIKSFNSFAESVSLIASDYCSWM